MSESAKSEISSTAKSGVRNLPLYIRDAAGNLERCAENLLLASMCADSPEKSERLVGMAERVRDVVPRLHRLAIVPKWEQKGKESQ